MPSWTFWFDSQFGSNPSKRDRERKDEIRQLVAKRLAQKTPDQVVNQFKIYQSKIEDPDTPEYVLHWLSPYEQWKHAFEAGYEAGLQSKEQNGMEPREKSQLTWNAKLAFALVILAMILAIWSVVIQNDQLTNWDSVGLMVGADICAITAFLLIWKGDITK